eukprot:GEZU01017813.1.p1 GENE.GEZU01017813.1~~GEZU01017813.1.p1  ORF type:complete len:253 (-),score=19.04 GEZU01017813.1:440-1198(-)
MVLTEKQKQDLHAAIFEYLASQGFENTKREFAKEAKLNEDELEQSSATTAQLEKKWTSVVRLQKKVMELEALVEAQKQQIDDFKSGAAYKQSKGTDYVPVAPAKFELSGHRAPVTGVLFHPTFNLLVSASEDASIRVWDFESGELEKSMRGHTNAVQHVSFDRTGNFLGKPYYISSVLLRLSCSYRKQFFCVCCPIRSKARRRSTFTRPLLLLVFSSFCSFLLGGSLNQALGLQDVRVYKDHERTRAQCLLR